MNLRYSEAAGGLAFEVKFDQDGRFQANDPCVVPRFDPYHLRRRKANGATVTIANADLPAREEAYVRMHTQICTGNGLHVS
jgi:hypothetical protein